MTVWSTIENKARAALANAATAPNHVAWLDAMANVPYGALGAAIEEIDRLRADVAAKHDVIAAMTESSQRIIDHAVQARARMAPLATFPVVTRIKPSVCDTNPMEAEHPTSDEPRPRVRLSVDRRNVYGAVTGCPCSECERKRDERHDPSPLVIDDTTLAPGLYRVFWKAGGSSLASIGMGIDGRRWVAPINWTHPSLDRWSLISRVERIDVPEVFSPEGGDGVD